MDNILLKITSEPKYALIRTELSGETIIKSIDDITIVKTPESTYTAVHPDYGPSRVCERGNELDAIRRLLSVMKAS